MYKKSVCISFDYIEDKNYRYLLKAWNGNSNFHFNIDDKTPGEISTWDISRVKAVLTTKIKSADYMLVIVGKKSNSLHPDRAEIGEKNWQIWEIEKAKELGKKIVAIKIDKGYDSPDALYGSNIKWVYTFAKNPIVTKLNEF